MPDVILLDDILIHRILTALWRANSDFARASRGWWATDFGAECLLQTRIFDSLAEAVADRPDIAVVMERQMGTGEAMRGRADIALEREDKTEVLPIEVKLHWNAETARPDNNRLLSWIQDRTDVRCGVFACLLHHNPRAKGHADLEAVRSAFQEAMDKSAKSKNVRVRCAYGETMRPAADGIWARHRDHEPHYDDWRLRPALAMFHKLQK